MKVISLIKKIAIWAVLVFALMVFLSWCDFNYHKIHDKEYIDPPSGGGAWASEEFVPPRGSLTRCNQYVQLVRRTCFLYYGLNFPYGYEIGKFRQESRCRATITAFDGGMGIAQFMPRTKEWVESKIGEFDAYNPQQAIKASIWYSSDIHQRNPDGRLWISYMFYNSGEGTVKREYRRAGEWDYELMKSVCNRRVITLNSGRLLDLCDVGYEYPQRIYKYGNPYVNSMGDWRYW